MRLALTIGGIAALMLGGCGGNTPAAEAPTSSAAIGVGLLPSAPSSPLGSAPTTIPTTTMPAPAITTTVPITTAPQPTILATTTVATAKCRTTGGVISTASGRHVVLRSKGLTGPSPTVLVLHGYTGTPAGIEKYSELTALANSDGVAVAYPEGTATQQGGFGWSTGAGMFATSGVDDVQALSDMVDAVVATGCVDPQRLVISGESNGAGMALVAICDRRLWGRFAAAVLVIPAVDDGVLARCQLNPSRPPIGLSVVAGKLDQTVGYAYGRPPLLPAEQWFATAASLVNRCTAVPPVHNQVDEFAERLTSTGCAVCTEMFAVADGTHTWPGSTRGTGGLRPGTFELNRRLVALARQPTQSCLE